MAATKKAANKTTNGFDAFAVNGDAFKDGFEKFNKGFEQIAEFQRESFDAVMSASGVVAQNVERLNAEQVEFAKTSFEDGVKAAKALGSCKSAQEALDVNTEFFRNAFEKNMAQFNKMTETVMSTGKDAIEPLTDSYNHFVETVQSYRP